ncbi:MAG TPA: cupin domain-containing protein [Pirellulales bacterium]|nr:cupin domain-containing protein [Pirellulales bacterium]
MIRQLLGDLPVRQFIGEYFLRQPFSLPGGASSLAHLGNWQVVETILAQPEADVLVVKEGRRWEGAQKPSPDEAARLLDEGYTVLVRHAERRHTEIAELAAGFARDFTAAVDVHLYCTPAGQHGFGWHYDVEDVFILQIAGSKEYSLRKNTVNPWPVLESLPQDMRYEREIMPLSRCLLSAGDWLYIPHGYWHKAEAPSRSISLAVGLMCPTALDLLDFLRKRLPDSIRWRQRLPVVGEALQPDDEIFMRHKELFTELGADLARLLRGDGLVRDWVEWRRSNILETRSE